MSLVDNYPITLRVNGAAGSFDTREVIFRALHPCLMVGNKNTQSANVYIYTYPELQQFAAPIQGDVKGVQWVCASPELDVIVYGYETGGVKIVNMSDFAAIRGYNDWVKDAVATDTYVYFAGTDKIEKVDSAGVMESAWSPLTSGATGRSYHSAVTYGDSMYVFGGSNGSNLNDLHRCKLYEPSISVYDIENANQLLTTKTIVGNIRDLKFDDQGNSLIAATDNPGAPIRIWNTADWSEVAGYGDIPENVLTASDSIELLPRR